MGRNRVYQLWLRAKFYGKRKRENQNENEISNCRICSDRGIFALGNEGS